MKTITKAQTGEKIRVQLYELFAVEVCALSPNSEFLAVPAFVQTQNFEIIREYAYHAPDGGNAQQMGKRIFLLMATQICESNLSWYNLSTAQQELQFRLEVSLEEQDTLGSHHSDSLTDRPCPNAGRTMYEA